ncbi:MAG: NAD(P)/FAD-dependent oxidoreductase [Acidobacteria bacterium]|nr:NAD(P)/FAD-dependent oxidoreductase [Acidobacteriota bacterium]
MPSCATRPVAVRSTSSPSGPGGRTKCWSSECRIREAPVPDARTVIVLGGGVGGVIAARELRRGLPRPHHVVLVDRERLHLFAPSLLWLMVGRREAAAIQRPLARLERKGIDVRIGEVERIDPVARRVTLAGGKTLDAGYLVVSLGAELDTAAIPGLSQAGHNFYTLPGAEAFRDALATLRAGRIVVMTAAPAYKCPAAPYEAAMLVDAFCRKRGHRDAVQIDVYAAEPAPMGVAGPEVSGAVKRLLADKGIAYHPEHQVTAADATTRRLSFANGAVAEFDLLAYVPPHRPPRAVRDSGLVAESGWVSVDRHTLETRFPGVYAIGDIVSIPLTLGKPLPKAGVFAHGEAEIVAKNIVHAITGAGTPRRFNGHGECFIEIGDGKAGWGGGNFYAEPKPEVTLRMPSWRSHMSKVLLEKSWLYTKL